MQLKILSMRQSRGGQAKNRKELQGKDARSSQNNHHKRKASSAEAPKSESQESLHEALLETTTSHESRGPLPVRERISTDLEVSEIFDPSQKKFESSGKPGSKTKRLQRLLEEAEKKRQRLEELKRAGAEGKQRAKEEMWVDALKEASGEKVYDNAAEIKKALKRREKRKEKSARQWRERLDRVSADKSARIEKRETNILKRSRRGLVVPEAEKVAEKRPRLAMVMKNAEAREGGSANESRKPRPGFEGKKVGFLNKKKSNHAQEGQKNNNL